MPPLKEPIELKAPGPWVHLAAAIAFAVLVTAMFADVLFSASPRVLSMLGADLSDQFIHWRNFGFGQIRHGELPLWDPHVFCGIPFLGGFQSALLYPPNFLYLVLPLGLATNIVIALHVFLTGFFMYLWASYRGLYPLASWLTGVLLMFSGPYFMHIYPGHLSNLCAMPWIPLIFLSIDGIFMKRTLGWALVGVASVSMIILAGHPQYVFYTAVAAALYCGLNLLKQPQRMRVVMLLAFVGLGAGLIVSVQLLTGLDEAAFTIRGKGGVPFEFAAMFSFPPENLITLLVPDFFGSLADNSYWGRCYLWEMSLFFSITGFVLAAYGRICGQKQQRRYLTILAIAIFVLALGAHTPLFRFLHDFVPGFNKFRGNSKYSFHMIVFVVMLAGVGMHRLMASPGPSWKWIAAIAGGAVVAAIAAVVTAASVSVAGDMGFGGVMNGIHAAAVKSHESYLPGEFYNSHDFILAAARRASNGLWIASGLLVLLAGSFMLLRRSRRGAYVLVALAVIELFAFARPLRPTFDLEYTQFPEVKKLVAAQKDDFRILNTLGYNSAMSTGAMDIWGTDPGVLRRYAEFLTFAQGGDPDYASQYVEFSGINRLLLMLRLKYVVTEKNGRADIIELPAPATPRLKLVDSFKVLEGRDAIFHELWDFDVYGSVILESQPDPLPQAGAEQGTAKVIDGSTDSLTIEAQLPTPRILVISDAYHPNWHIRALPGSSQKKYEIMPADYIFRAIPLSAGFHRFTMEYRPRLFVIGKWISIASLAAYLILCGFLTVKKVSHVSCFKQGAAPSGQ